MIEQNVQVVRREGERLWIRIGSRAGCIACENGQGCGAGLFARLLRRKPVVLELAAASRDVKAGQMMTLAIPERVYLRLVLATYGWPLLAALAGALAGHSLGTWLHLGPVWIDAVALSGGLLMGSSLMRLGKDTMKKHGILETMDMAVCYPARDPHACERVQSELVSPSSDQETF